MYFKYSLIYVTSSRPSWRSGTASDCNRDGLGFRFLHRFVTRRSAVLSYDHSTRNIPNIKRSGAQGRRNMEIRVIRATNKKKAPIN